MNKLTIILLLFLQCKRYCYGNDNFKGKFKAGNPNSIVESFLENNLEVHEVTTEDGYILTVHRLHGPEGSIPVFLQHGFLGDSIGWFVLGNKNSLPYMLFNSGYDVWLGNARGTTYSKKHKTLSTSDSKFWDFSWHEQGYYDLPAAINYITNLTSNSLYYVGHSQGCTSFSVMAIERPEIAKKVRAMVALAPAPYVYHIESGFFNFLYKHSKFIMNFSGWAGIHEFVPRSFLFDFIANYGCRILPSGCISFFIWFDGTDYKNNLYDVLVPEMFYHSPSGIGRKLFNHTVQQIDVNEFRKYDYGPTKNLEIYNSPTPPNYDLSKIDVPIATFYSANDKIIVPEDALHFYEQIPKKWLLVEVEDETFNHLGFLAAPIAPELVYKRILKLFENFKSKGYQ